MNGYEGINLLHNINTDLQWLLIQKFSLIPPFSLFIYMYYDNLIAGIQL